MAPAKDRPAITDVWMPIMITLILQFFKEAALTTYLNGSDWKNTSPPVVSICYSFPDSESLSAPCDHQQSFCNYTVQQLFNVYNICSYIETPKQRKLFKYYTHTYTAPPPSPSPSPHQWPFRRERERIIMKKVVWDILYRNIQ
jgi:hypothetical protein